MSFKFEVAVVEHGGGRALTRIVEHPWQPHVGENLLIFGDYYQIIWIGLDAFNPGEIPKIRVDTDALDIDLLCKEDGWTRERF